MGDSLEIVCAEALVASLRDEKLREPGILRNIYVSLRPLGTEGSAGKIQQGDLTSDIHAKIISFDYGENAYVVTRNGKPPSPPEFVPDGDIGALLRSFVRDMWSFGQVYLTVTDSVPAKGIEVVRKVIPGQNLEMECTHGPHETARGMEWARRNASGGNRTALFSLTGGLGGGLVVSWNVIGVVLAVLLLCILIYLKFYRNRKPSNGLPDTRPFILEQKHGARKLQLNDQTEKDAVSALRQIRAGNF